MLAISSWRYEMPIILAMAARQYFMQCRLLRYHVKAGTFVSAAFSADNMAVKCRLSTNSRRLSAAEMTASLWLALAIFFTIFLK